MQSANTDDNTLPQGDVGSLTLLVRICSCLCALSTVVICVVYATAKDIDTLKKRPRVKALLASMSTLAISLATLYQADNTRELNFNVRKLVLTYASVLSSLYIYCIFL